ncbi:glycosyltransferase family 9 protein [Desulfovibrio sp.]|uniref:glycosyltransferase family 9 protein n=1 Tax=Desulfovibrio sp. TaxID=885 RepID=UPI0023D5254A|nr:glycosyltransferase family 9 protein [Desulfovibrio sp.]MDE7240387.1 glycosyltransferase family 9 protein [Desulfovibrio sp.]
MAKFLVVQAARFGDLVQSKRLILTLREQGDVHLAVDAGLAPLARLLYPGVAVHGLAFHGHDEAAAQARNLPAFADLRALAPDVVYNCNFSRLTGALCRLFPPETVIGYRAAPASDGGLLRSPWARLAFRLSRRRRLSPLNLVDFWAWFAPGPVAPERVNPRARPGGRGLGVALSGREARRSLPVPLLAEVVKTLSGVLGGPRIHLLGSAAERPAAHKLLRLLPPKLAAHTEDLSGKTDWPSLVDAVTGLDLLVTPDTGLMHLAAHLGTPTLAFFLSSAWCHETGPYGLGHTIWQAASPCAPCLESAPCPRNVACLEVFQDAGFARQLARSLAWDETTRASAPALPPGLQCWRSGLDGFGAKLRLVAGEDPDALLREGARAVLADWLGLPPVAVEAPRPETREQRDELRRLGEALLPDAEWMLPQGRYA